MDAYTAPDFRTAALMVIDVQKDTLDGQPFEVPGTSRILPNISRLIEAFRASRRLVVFIVRLYRPDGSNVDLCRRKEVEEGRAVFIAGSEGSQIPPPLLSPDIRLDHQLLMAGGIQYLGREEVILYKPRWGAFYGTLLVEFLTSRHISTLIFTGCNFPNCPRASIYEASERDFRIVLVKDAVSGLCRRGMREMENIGVALLTTNAVLKSLK